MAWPRCWPPSWPTTRAGTPATVEFGGTTAPDDLVEVTIPAEAGATLVIPGWLIKGNATPLVVKAFADTANVITVNGYVNQKTA